MTAPLGPRLPPPLPAPPLWPHLPPGKLPPVAGWPRRPWSDTTPLPPGRLHLKVIPNFKMWLWVFSLCSCPWAPFPPCLASTRVPFAPPPSCPGRHPMSAFNQSEVSPPLAAKSCSLIYLCALCVLLLQLLGAQWRAPANRFPPRAAGGRLQGPGARQPCRPAGALTPTFAARKVPMS